MEDILKCIEDRNMEHVEDPIPKYKAFMTEDDESKPQIRDERTDMSNWIRYFGN